MYGRHLFLCLVVCLTPLTQGTTNTSEQESFIDLKTGQPVNITEFCKKVPCLVKCCPTKQILMRDVYGTTCINNTDGYSIESPFNYDGMDIYNQDIKRNVSKTKKKLKDFTFLYHEKFLDLDYCCLNLLDVFTEPANVNYLTEDGRLLTMRFNYFDNWESEITADQFCFDNEITVYEDGTVQSETPQIAFYIEASNVTESSTAIQVSAYGMLVSSGFMILTLAVYGLLKELRNMAGMLLMAYVATLTMAFLSRVVQVFANGAFTMDTTHCIVVGLIVFYLVLASFTWMNVMSFDIWWSMRGFRKSRRIHRRGIPVKFAWYCLYGWGVPLMYLIFVVIVEHIDLKHLPNFVKPHIIVDTKKCFFSDQERQLYLNGPIAITTFANIVLFLMTVYNIWRIKSGVAKSAESTRNKKDDIRFVIYLKLSLVMGISWILEVLSSLVYHGSKVWYISDVYNSLVGLFIFIIFVCKRSVIALLYKRFDIDNEYTRKWIHDGYSTKTTSARRDKKNAPNSLTDNSDVGDA